MAVSKKGSRKIIVEDNEFRWSATGNDGWITIVIWADNNCDFKLIGTFEYHNEWEEKSDENGRYRTAKGQIIVTNRIIRKIIEHVGIEKILRSKGQLNLGDLENIYDVKDALRAELD